MASTSHFDAESNLIDKGTFIGAATPLLPLGNEGNGVLSMAQR